MRNIVIESPIEVKLDNNKKEMIFVSECSESEVINAMKTFCKMNEEEVGVYTGVTRTTKEPVFITEGR